MEQLATIAAALTAPRERIEGTFVQVGSGLAEGAALLNRVTRIFEALPAQLQSPELDEATARLAAIGNESQAIAQIFATEQADLARLVDVVAAADRPIGELKRTVKMMSIVAINARVVAASVVGDGDDFDVFTTDIAALSESASRTIQDFTAVYHQLTGEVSRAAHQRQQFDAGHAGTLQSVTAGLTRTLAAVADQRHISLEGSRQTGLVTRQIVGRIGGAVMALQVGDATRQRLEHIEAAIDHHVGAPAPIPEAICALAAAQLEAALADYQREVAEADTALLDLAADASTIMAHSQSIYGTGGASPLATLSADVRHAALVLRDCEGERNKLETVARAVQETVQTLLSHVEAVQEIEANMRLVSLNAAVKCAQLGPRGTALNVIARQLRELTGETVAAAEAAMAGLHQAAALAQSFGASTSGDAAGRVGRLEQEASAALALLEHVDQSLAQALATLHRDGPEVIGLLQRAAAAFSDQSGIVEVLQDLHLQLVAHAPLTLPEQTIELAEVLAALRKRYTMDAERQLHDAMFPMHDAPANDDSSTTEFDLDSMLL